MTEQHHRTGHRTHRAEEDSLFRLSGYILVVGLLLTDLHVVVGWVLPITKEKRIDIFFSPNYKESITVSWYLYEITAIIYRFLWAYVFCLIGKRYSGKLLRLAFIFLIYYFIDGLMYIWNRNSYFFANMIIYLLIGMAVTVVVFSKKHRMKIV